MAWEGKDRRDNVSVNCSRSTEIDMLMKSIYGNGQKGLLDRMTGLEVTANGTHSIVVSLSDKIDNLPKQARDRRSEILSIGAFMVAITAVILPLVVQ